MLKSNLIELLGGFKQKEFKELGEFLRSPFINKNEGVIKLYDYLSKSFPDFEEEKLEKKDVFNNIYPGADFNDSFIKTIIYNLERLAEKFLIYKKLSQDTFKQDIYLLEELDNRNLRKLFKKKLKAAESALVKAGLDDQSYFHYRTNFDGVKAYSTSKDTKTFNEPNVDISKISVNLINDFLMNILSHYIAVINETWFMKKDIKLDFIEEILRYLRNNKKHLRVPLISINYFIILLLREEKDVYFYEIKRQLINNINNLKHIDKMGTITILNNYGIKRESEGHDEFIKERFELFEFAIKNNILSYGEDYYFNDKQFINIVTCGIKLGKFTWVQYFINKYKDTLSPEYRDLCYNYNMARLYFSKGMFNEALEKLSTLKSLKRVEYKIFLRTLTLKIYFELGLTDKSDAYLDAFKHFIAYNKNIPEIYKKGSGNFVRFLISILKLKENPDKKGLKKLKDKILNTNYISEKSWLIEKINELLSQ